MSIGYNPVRQPLQVAQPLNLPSNYGMVDKQADIQASAATASTLGKLAPSLMELGVSLKLKEEGRLGYEKDKEAQLNFQNESRKELAYNRGVVLETRSKADYAGFTSYITNTSNNFSVDLSTMTDKAQMDDAINIYTEKALNRVTGADGDIPLIRNERQQEEYQNYIKNVYKPHLKSMEYARLGAIDAQNTKEKAKDYITMGVNQNDPEMINNGVQLEVNAGLKTEEQGKLAIKDYTYKAETKDVSRWNTAIRSGNRFSYLSILGITEEEAEKKGYTNADLAKMTAEEFINRVDNGMYKELPERDLEQAKIDALGGAEAVSIQSETRLANQIKMEKKAAQTQTYSIINNMATVPNFENLSPDIIEQSVMTIDPSTKPEEAARLAKTHIVASTKPMTRKQWTTYTQLLQESTDYKPENDKDGKIAGSLYKRSLTLPSDKAHTIISRLNRKIKKLPLGKVSSVTEKVIVTKINDTFTGIKDTGWVFWRTHNRDWMGEDVATITINGERMSISEAQAMLTGSVLTYIEKNDLTDAEALEYVDENPILQNLSNIHSMSQLQIQLDSMSDPTKVRKEWEIPNYTY